jgi:hypothetical protein
MENAHARLAHINTKTKITSYDVVQRIECRGA